MEPGVTVCKVTAIGLLADTTSFSNRWTGVYLMGTGKTVKKLHDQKMSKINMFLPGTQFQLIRAVCSKMSI